MWRKPRRVKRLADPVVSPDQQSLWVRIETEGGLSGDVDIPLTEVTKIFNLLIMAGVEFIAESGGGAGVRLRK